MRDFRLLGGLVLVFATIIVLLVPMLPWACILGLADALHCYKVSAMLYTLADRYGEAIARPLINKVKKVLPEGVAVNF